ncbi:MAG: hypothetical protein AAGM38_04700 [Pseudomonadota bacterium]
MTEDRDSMTPFQEMRLPRTGARPLAVIAAPLWSREARATLPDGAEARCAAHLYWRADGGGVLSLIAERWALGERDRVLARVYPVDRQEDLAQAAASFDPSRLCGAGFGAAALDDRSLAAVAEGGRAIRDAMTTSIAAACGLAKSSQDERTI